MTEDRDGRDRGSPSTERLYRALTYPLLSVDATVAGVLVAAATYVLLVASTNPLAVARAASTGVGTVDDLVVLFSVGVYRTAGPLGLALTFVYAVLAGVTTVVVAARLRRGVGVGGTGTSGLLGVAPGVLAAGCASCGAGVLPLLGVAGAYALFPFAGNLVRLAGIGLLLIALVRTGDPRRCELRR